jgi:DinB superfamily
MSDSALRKHIVDLLSGRGAHVHFDRAIEGLPVDAYGECPNGAEHSPWEIVEHMRIAQWDILEFCRNADHVSPDWPAGYWPENSAPLNESAWSESVAAFRADLEAMMELVRDPGSDLFTPVPHGDGQTLLREALLVADHNAYHLGEFVVIRRLLRSW